jgi:2,4-dienoyl-CoA reductase (NADPH2)
MPGGEELVPADTVVLAKKPKANMELEESLRETDLELYAVGDCVAPRKALNAFHEGFRAGLRI